METVSGNDLLETFNSLGINTGNVSKLTIDSWFDTNCEASKEMLHWMCKYLGKENVLTAHENEEYEQTLENRSLLPEKRCEAALSHIQADYPGILDYEETRLDVECMEDELEMLLEEERHLEQLLNINSGLSKKLTRDVQKANEEEITSTVKREAAQKKCMELSYKLDGAHEKLQQQISRYADHLNEFEHATNHSFISNIPTVKYNEYYSDVVSYLSLLIRREYEVLPKLEVTVKSARKRLQDSILISDGTVDQLEVLRQRIFKSIRGYFCQQVKEEQIRAEIRFLQELNLNEVMAPTSQDCSFQFMLEANIISKKELLERVFLDMESVAQQVCNEFVDTPKINLLEHTISINQKKFDSLSQIDIKTTEIVAKHILLQLLLLKEKNDIQSTDKFFRDVHYYITQNLLNCQIRTETMMEVIDEHRIYKNLPLEQKFKMVGVIKALLNNEENNSADVNVLDAIKSFSNESNKLEQQVFFGDYAEHWRFTQKIQQEMDIMRRFLISGPTSQIISIPHQLIEGFNKTSEMYETQEASLKFAMQILSDAEKKLLNNKWLRVKRQLWMWFLFEPKRVLSAIEQVEAAVKQKRNESA